MLQLTPGKYLGQVCSSWTANGVLVTEAAYPIPAFEGWHAHENYHISYIMQGGNREQRKGSETDILPGEVVRYRSGELHRNLDAHRRSRNINLEIEHSFFDAYGLDADTFNVVKCGEADAKFAILKIYRECTASDHYSPVAVHSLLLGLMHTKEGSPKDKPRWATQLRDILHDRWDENVPLQELALLLQVHPVTISKYFPRYFHCTLGEYLRKIRIEKAIGLVQTDGLPLTAVAHRCGFFDQSHFIRAFKNMTGFLPGAYKKLAG